MISLKILLQAQPETLNSLSLSAEGRLDEAYILYHENKNTAAIYLAGYAAEMWLKYAYFRFKGAALGADVQSRLEPAKSRAGKIIPNISHEGFHSLRFWFRFIAEERTIQGCPLQQQVELEFMVRILEIYSNWWVGLRYRPYQAHKENAAALLNNVQWMNQNINSLWR